MVKLNPKTYSLKQARADLESCNRLIIEKTEQFTTLKTTIDKLEEGIKNLSLKKIYIKSILKQKRHFIKKYPSQKRIERLLKY